jgi:hypothetical protein
MLLRGRHAMIEQRGGAYPVCNPLHQRLTGGLAMAPDGAPTSGSNSEYGNG